MLSNFMHLRYIYTSLLVILTFFKSAAFETVEGEWRIHPSADIYSCTNFYNGYNNCVKIFDGERYTYFQVLQQEHDSHENFPDFHIIATSIFRYDKQNPADNPVSLTSLYDVSGFDVECANYSIKGKYLAVAYKNGAIDIFHDDGRITVCNGIKNYPNPSDKEINSIVNDIDGSKFYVATNFGYAVIDSESGNVLCLSDLGTSYSFVSRIGNKIVLFKDPTIYTVDAGDNYGMGETPEIIKIDDNFSTTLYRNQDKSPWYPDALTPISENSFLYLTRSTPNIIIGPVAILMTFRPDGVAGMIPLLEDKLDYAANGSNVRSKGKSINEGFITESSDCWIFKGTTSFHNFKKGIDIDFTKSDFAEDVKSRILSGYEKSGLPATIVNQDPNHLKMASVDAEHFWVFYPREGFKRFIYKEGIFSPLNSSTYLAKAPNLFRASAFDYHPATGMMVRNVGEELGFGALGNQSDGLSEYKDGEWTYHGFDKTYPTYRSRAILPHGVAIDPNNPKYVYSGSRYYGLLRMNLEDPSDFLQLSRSNSGNINKPGFVAAHEPSKEWGNLSCFGRPMFDNDCTLWTSFLEFDTYYAEQPLSNIWFWTAEDRAASEKASQDPSLYEPMGVIKVPTGSVTADSNIYVFKEEQNDNLIGFVPNGWFDGFVLDHNGTPKDTSDDKIAYLTDIYDDQTGEKLLLRYPTCMFEDTYDNSILVAYYDGILVTTREKLFDSERKTGHFMKTSDDDDEQPGVVIAQTSLTGIAVDAQNRKWLATEGSGLFCVSADRKHILDQFTIDNSKLPSDNCLGVFFNPETQSVWTGTDAGLVEFVPTGSEGSTNTYSAQTPKAMQEFVEPGYHGYIKLTNLIDNKSYDIVGPDGNVVMTAKPESGAIQVHAFGLSKGEYEVRVNGAQEKVIGFTVM